jgi:hypothetical protein
MKTLSRLDWLFAIFLSLALLGAIATRKAHSEAYPLPKGKEQCPSGWQSTASYCLPPPGAKQCIPKRGSCPSGYRSSGGSCCAN